ncbi:thermonuclease family protein [Williamsia sterculiae]|uniref:Micrococcal nuclease n=1 Tax=Williamsia sterculiae TaxID=1344003 RepID=A0A1N7HE42_9NOCA|nr:thermonuclease family protein [Williamsia sterculiae]SIS23147.1 micrococcal nuclease [Williamsia sterculiae]
MNARTWLTHLVTAVAVLAGAAGCGHDTPQPSHQAPSSGVVRFTVHQHGRPAHVDRVVDGDTLIATYTDGSNHRVTIRLIGVDTPETKKPHTPVQCWGPQASALTDQLATGHQVNLETDPRVDRVDRYGRTLAYIWIQHPGHDDTMLNQTLLTAGAAREYDYDHQNYKYRDQFRAAQTAAQHQRAGLWGQCGTH